MADVYQALSSPIRREILQLLKKKNMSAGEIAEQFDVAKSTLSGHFNVLKSAELILPVKDGTTITYSINTSVVEELLAGLFDMFGKHDSNS
jgi:ArsR family transcriptional regulator, arsenate/arsenite/antimonite-responsive transcriptional repressor